VIGTPKQLLRLVIGNVSNDALIGLVESHWPEIATASQRSATSSDPAADCTHLADLAEAIHGDIGWPAKQKKQARQALMAAIRAKA